MISDTKENRLEILNKLGYESFKKRNYIEAIIYYTRYIEIDQTNPIIYNMLGFLYQKMSKYQNIDKQIEFFEKALKLKPDYVQTLRNLALAYPYIGKYEEAIKCFKKMFELGPVMDDYMAYACLQIRLKNFEEGWKYYEYRFLKEYTPTEYPKMDKPKWEGQEIKDKTLLVQYEQGFGDSIQFFRYLEQLKPLTGKIIFRVQNELADLFKSNTKDIEIVGISTPVAKLNFDYHIPLMSLMLMLKANADNIPFPEGYLKADNKKTEYYKKEFFNNDCFKIGISWSGTKFGNRYRNVPLKYFLPLTNLKNVKVYSFQKGYGYEQLQDLESDTNIIDLGKTFKDFSDTAAAIANLDLFITSDNGVFNLAGAMGKKTFVLFNKYPEWRWFLDEKTTPWYKSVEIFKKQDENDSWGILMEKVLESIRQK